MNLLSYLFPQTVYKTESPFNGEIKVNKYWGKYSMLVGGISQSGGLVKNIWQKGIKEAKKRVENIDNVLVLGLGCGTVGEIINKELPDARIIGIEIDPVVIDIGKKYFKLSHLNNLEIKITDAKKKLDDLPNNKSDLILVDLYQGKNIPKFLENNKFLFKIKQKISKKGIVIFNRLYWKNYVFEARKFLDKLKKIFNDVDSKKTYSNILFFAK